jgi:Flp pilus assembly protein TadD
VVEAEPGVAEAWLGRAACRQRLGDADGARDDLRQAAVMAPDQLAAEVMVAGGVP